MGKAVLLVGEKSSFVFLNSTPISQARIDAAFPSTSEQMGIEEMILVYTINGAKQLGIEASKGSIESGKDADFLIFDEDLLTEEHEGFSYNKPRDVYFCGKKVN